MNEKKRIAVGVGLSALSHLGRALALALAPKVPQPRGFGQGPVHGPGGCPHCGGHKPGGCPHCGGAHV